MACRGIRKPVLSLIVPTKERPRQLRQLLRSLAATAAAPAALEVVLVIDAGDYECTAFTFDQLPLKKVVVEPGHSMGALNTAGYKASAGDYLMLLNDDVIARTRKWDRKVLACFRDLPDRIALVHVNDILFGAGMCTFPIVSRTFCELAGGICPREYLRYRIDDHIEDIFNLLTFLGDRRTVYLPDVVFEHQKFITCPEDGRRYVPDPAILAVDAPRFEAAFPERKELALRLKEYIAGPVPAELRHHWRTLLEQVHDYESLRVAGRQRVKWHGWHVRRRLAGGLRRVRAGVRQWFTV
jgi:hypothetical protein